MIVLDLSIIFFALLALFYSGGIMVRSLTLMGRFLQISEYMLSFVLVAFATSLPEFFIGLSSAINNSPLLSVGNIVGANVLNATMVLGAAVIVAVKLDFNQVIKKEDIQVTLGLLLLPVLLLLDGYLSRNDGFILLFFFGGYLVYLFNQERETPAVDGLGTEKPTLSEFMKNLGKFALAALALLISSHLAVSKSVVLSQAFSLPLFFIGIIVAIGTTLPETIFGIKSVLLGHKSMAFGNALGSIIVNLSLILGMVAAIRPIEITEPSRVFFGLLLAASLVTLIQLIRLTKGYISRPFGFFLLFIAIAFIIIELVLSVPIK